MYHISSVIVHQLSIIIYLLPRKSITKMGRSSENHKKQLRAEERLTGKFGKTKYCHLKEEGAMQLEGRSSQRREIRGGTGLRQ